MTEPTAGDGQEEVPPPASDPYGTPPPGSPPPGYGQVPQPGYFPPAPPAPPGWGQYAAVPPGMWFDQQSGLVIPNGVELASVGRRIGAYFLSFLLAIVTLGVGYAIWGLIVWGRGTSPALQVLGMKCWRFTDHQVAGWGTMALRDVVGTIVQTVFLGVGGVISFILFLASKEHKSLSDLIGSTVVLHDPNHVLG